MGKIRLSCDDGCASDVRVAELAKKYGIDCVFYWPVEWHSLAYDNGYEPLRYTDALKIAEAFEIGSHGITHRHLTKISVEEAKYEILRSRDMLSELFDAPIRKFCPSRGYLTDELKQYVKHTYGQYRLTKGPGLVHIHPDSGANGNKPWLDCIDENTTEIWGHSWEFDKYNLWQELEAFLEASHS